MASTKAHNFLNILEFRGDSRGLKPNNPREWRCHPWGQVAVGMGFQNVVAWRIFELRRSHLAVQPAAPALGVNWWGN